MDSLLKRVLSLTNYEKVIYLKFINLLSRSLGKDPLVFKCIIIFNRFLFIIISAFGDTGVNGYLFINTVFVNKIKKYLRLRIIRNFKCFIGGYRGKAD